VCARCSNALHRAGPTSRSTAATSTCAP
jgi:hypothetical protein